MWNTDYPNAELYSAHNICFILPHRETEAKATFSAWITPPPRKEKVVGGGGGEHGIRSTKVSATLDDANGKEAEG